MSQKIDSILDIASDYDAIIFDQWGVLHNGSEAYPQAVQTLNALVDVGLPLAVLSNSGKRSDANLDRISAMGFNPGLFQVVMTSGEALWQDLSKGAHSNHQMFVVERTPGDAAVWAEGLSLDLVASPEAAKIILLMGIPDGASVHDFDALLHQAVPYIICSNPDKQSPRAGEQTVLSPGYLAQMFEAAGQRVIYYGKPHLPIFQALSEALDVPLGRMLMVGDSLEHDVAGGRGAGCATLLVRNGLYAQHFAGGGDLLTLIARYGAHPDYVIDFVQ